MADLKDLFTAPLESSHTKASQVAPEPAGDSPTPPQRFSQFAPVKNAMLLVAAYMWEEHKGPVIVWGVLLVCALLVLAVALGADLNLPLG